MIQSVRKAMEILSLVAIKEKVSLRELSQLTSMPKSTVSNLARTLVSVGYLYQDDKNGDYYISYKFLRIGQDQLEKIGIRECIFPEMRKLANITGETINLTVLDENRVLSLRKIESSNIYHGIKVGSHVPLHTSAAGKIILANLPLNRYEEILAASVPLEKLTDNTITDLEQLKIELDIARQKGYSISRGEVADGVIAIAAFIRDFPIREGAAVSIAGPSNRVSSSTLEEWGNLIVQASNEISRKLKT